MASSSADFDDDDDLRVEDVRTRAERDAEGWANAIVISSDSDDDVPVHRLAHVKKASTSSALGKRPAPPSGDDVKPDVKPDISDTVPHVPAPPPQQAPAVQSTTNLDDQLTFSAPLKGAMPGTLRAGHVTLKVSTMAVAGSTHMDIGTGFEYNSHARVQAVPWQVRIEDGAGGELIGAIKRLANPANCRKANQRVGTPLIEVQWQPKLPWRLKRGDPPVAVRLDVYLRPEIFRLRISGWHSAQSCFYDIWQLFDKLTPMAPYVDCPRPPPVHGDVALAPCGAAAASAAGKAARPPPNAHAFTLNGLMRAMESAGYAEAADPPGLKLTLYPFQRQSLQWMLDRETQSGGLNTLFWREYASEGAQKFWYNPMAGELRDVPLPVVSGGFLCARLPRVEPSAIAPRPAARPTVCVVV